MIKCTQIRETNAAGYLSLRSDALIKSRGVAPAIRKKIAGPSNPDDLNARHRRVNTRWFPSRETGFPWIPQKQRPSKSIKHACV